MIKGAEEVGNRIISLITTASMDSASPFVDVVIDKFGPTVLSAYFAITKESIEKNPEFKVRVITDVQAQNVGYVREIIKGGKRIEVRHSEGNIRKFVYSRTEALETSHSLQNGQPEEAVYSTDPDFVAQLSQVFDVLWQRAIPADQRMGEIERGEPPKRTEILRGAEETASISLKVFSNAENYFCAVSDWRAPSLAVDVEIYRKSYLDMMRRGVNVRAITEIKNENLNHCKELLRLGLVSELRHIEGSMGNYLVTEKEYLAAPSIQESTQAQEVIYSNDKGLVAQNKYVFDTLWSKAVPAEVRIRQLEEGIEPEETRLIQSVDELITITVESLEQCKEEALVIFASEKTIKRNAKLFKRLAERQASKDIRRLRILSPVEDRGILDVLPNVEWREIVPLNISLFVFDRNKMLLVQYSNPEADSRELAFSNGVYTTNMQTISGFVAVFDALWKESELRKLAESLKEKETIARRQAELLQDILTHDIRNYNQISWLSAELLQEELGKNNSSVKSILDGLLRSISGSTALLERVRKLSKIITETSPSLYPVDLLESIESSFEIVKNAFPEKRILRSSEPELEGRAIDVMKPKRLFVQADDLLGEVFVNILTNAIKYTETKEVPIEVSIVAEDTTLSMKEGQRYCRVTITDHGRGIPEEFKTSIFTRYFHAGTHSGSGLGLAIVHALVADRYHGTVVVSDRVSGDYTKGTKVELCLPLAIKQKEEGAE
jgi:two-component system sensor histidine kinase VicK